MAASRESPKQARTVTPSPGSASRWGVSLAGSVVIVLATLAVYHNSFSGPFIFDDAASIATNPSIHQFRSALMPPPNLGVGGRPIINLSYAVNYALGEEKVWGYHAFNLLVHALAGLTLFGLLRRTLLRPPLNGRFGAEAVLLALAVAVIWTVHPLQTEAVTYISQRAESLMGLFYLLTLYCLVRGAESRSQESGIRHHPPEVRNQEKEFKTQNPETALPPSSRLTPERLTCFCGSTASILACLLGGLCKEDCRDRAGNGAAL